MSEIVIHARAIRIRDLGLKPIYLKTWENPKISYGFIIPKGNFFAQPKDLYTAAH